MTGSGPRGQPWATSEGGCPGLQVLPFGEKTGKMWLCSMASLLSSSSAVLSVKKSDHRNKLPGSRFGREGALSLGANQHECVYAFVRDGKVECEKQGGMERDGGEGEKETTEEKMREMMCVSR